MADEHLATYLNDHLAGSVAAVELLEHLEQDHKGTALESFATELRTDIEADRKELAALMKELGIAESSTRKATAWIAEKFSELKLIADDPAGGVLRLLETLEAISLGIEGKLALWRALAATAEDAPGLRVVDYERLGERAIDQRQRVEEVRLVAARKALRPSA